MPITDEPGNLDATPLKSRPGDLRHAPDTFKWPISWRDRDPLLARAADYHRGGSQTRAAEHIVDREPAGPPFAEELTPLELRELEEAQELPGGLRKSAWRGRVLSVR
jgi:hypothetical protein